MYGMKFVWVDDGLPLGGDVMLLDDNGEISALLDRRAFHEDPDAFMASFERHCDLNVQGHGWTLSLPVAVGEGFTPIRPPEPRITRHLQSLPILPLTGCAGLVGLLAHAFAGMPLPGV